MAKEKQQPIDILLVTFNRLHFLKYTVKKIYERTDYPHRLWVIDNCSSDNTQRWLKKAKLFGYIYDYLFMDENIGLGGAFSKGFDHVNQQKSGMSDYMITTQDDIVPPKLSPCWLTRMLHLFQEYEDDYAALAMRVQRTRHKDVDEHKELIPASNSCPCVFRMQKKKDVIEMGNFGYAKHWETVTFANKMKTIGKPRLAIATHLYADHTGFMPDNKGFAEGYTTYHTYSKERVQQGKDQPYPDIDPKTNIPMKINTHRDRHEQKAREDYWNWWGLDKRRGNKHLGEDQILLKPYAEKGKGIEVGPGVIKCHPNAIGVDIFSYKTADILGSGDDLWMFKDEELDFVIASHCLEHFPDTKAVLREWKRVLKPKGIIAVCVPDGEIRPGVIRDPHKVIFTKEVLRIIFKFDLRMKPIRWEDIPNKSKGQESILVVAKKTK